MAVRQNFAASCPNEHLLILLAGTHKLHSNGHTFYSRASHVMVLQMRTHKYAAGPALFPPQDVLKKEKSLRIMHRGDLCTQPHICQQLLGTGLSHQDFKSLLHFLQIGIKEAAISIYLPCRHTHSCQQAAAGLNTRVCLMALVKVIGNLRPRRQCHHSPHE